MTEIRTPRDIYTAVDDVIGELRSKGFEADANVLEHRLYAVAWTTGGELFEELVKVLSDLEARGGSRMPGELSRKIHLVLDKLQEALAQAAALRVYHPGPASGRDLKRNG